MSVILDEKRFPELIRTLYEVVGELHKMAEGLHFTPDGHMVGGIGQALISYHYGVELREAADDGHNGTKDGRLVQMRATQREAISISQPSEHLIAIRLDSDGGFEQLYNGPGGPVWDLTKDMKPQKSGYFSISRGAMKRLMESVPDKDRLPRLK